MYNTNTYLYMCACAFKYTQLGDTYFFYLFIYSFIKRPKESEVKVVSLIKITLTNPKY